MKRIAYIGLIVAFVSMFVCIFVLLAIGRDTIGPLGLTWGFWLTAVGFLGIGMATSALVLASWVVRRRQQLKLYERPELNDGAFAQAYGETAMILRQLLTFHVKMDLNGLRPDDRLRDDLGVELINEPSLFNNIRRRFGVSASVEDNLDTYNAMCGSLVTFRDLVECVESILDEESIKEAGEPGS